MSASDSRLAVAHVDHTTDHGGAEIALARILGHDPRPWRARLTLPHGVPLGVFDDLDDVEIVRAGRPQRPGAAQASPLQSVRIAVALARQAGALRRSGALHGVDVVHANSTRSATYAAMALWGTKVPLVVHLRDRIEPEAIGAGGATLFRRVVLPRATGFIANSASTARTVGPRLRGAQFVDVVPSAIGMDRATEATTPQGRVVRIGIVARLAGWKGQDELIRAFAGAGIAGRATLRIVGGPAFGGESVARHLVELARELGVDGDVDFAGHRENVQEEIDALNVGVQYSTRPEPLGQNVLQYLARGKAVVAAAEGGPTEWIRDGTNGILVPPRDVGALSAALRRLVDDRALLDRLAAGARATPSLPTDGEVVRSHERAFARAVAGSH